MKDSFEALSTPLLGCFGVSFIRMYVYGASFDGYVHVRTPYSGAYAVRSTGWMFNWLLLLLLSRLALQPEV